MATLQELSGIIVRCRKCPRLVRWREEVAKKPPPRYQGMDYWAKPLTGFGDPRARLLIVGLAPAAHGGNRTGRIFTGDRSGDWLYETLHAFGFSNQASSMARDDGLRLIGCYITAAVRCAPPGNKPSRVEFEKCRQQNTFTGKLTRKMFHEVFGKARDRLKAPGNRHQAIGRSL